MSSPSDIILLLQDANDIPSIRAALLAATHFSTDATVQAEVQIAEQRLERLVRLAKLTPPMMSAPLTPVRQQSHRQRMHLLMESRLKKALISMGNNVIDLSATERLMKDACHDDRCGDCSQSAEPHVKNDSLVLVRQLLPGKIDLPVLWMPRDKTYALG